MELPSDVLAQAALIRRSVNRLARRLRSERPPGSVSLTKLSLLAHLQLRGPLSPSELATLERSRLQSLTRVLAELVAQGLISRELDPVDRRRSIVNLTAAGRRALADDMRQRDRWLASRMATLLSPTERELLRLAAELAERLVQTEDENAGDA